MQTTEQVAAELSRSKAAVHRACARLGFKFSQRTPEQHQQLVAELKHLRRRRKRTPASKTSAGTEVKAQVEPEVIKAALNPADLLSLLKARRSELSMRLSEIDNLLENLPGEVQ